MGGGDGGDGGVVVGRQTAWYEVRGLNDVIGSESGAQTRRRIAGGEGARGAEKVLFLASGDGGSMAHPTCAGTTTVGARQFAGDGDCGCGCVVDSGGGGRGGGGGDDDEMMV